MGWSIRSRLFLAVIAFLVSGAMFADGAPQSKPGGKSCLPMETSADVHGADPDMPRPSPVVGPKSAASATPALGRPRVRHSRFSGSEPSNAQTPSLTN